MSTGSAVQQGWNQQTHATQHILRKAMGGKAASSGTTTRRKKKRAVAAAPRKRRAKRVKSARKGRLVAGSAAAKAWGAKMKRARKK